jgi:NAD-dependent dihydropyrimidine dehydrogenase PreA subunit
MVLQVNQELCAGCGVCIEACSVGAIRLVDQRAEINTELCTQCEACIDACLNGAITAMLEPAPLTPYVSLVTETHNNPAPARTLLPAANPPDHSLTAMAGTALTFLVHEVAPRLVDVLAAALERRLERPITTAVSPLPDNSKAHVIQGRGNRRRARLRGKHSDKRIHLA